MLVKCSKPNCENMIERTNFNFKPVCFTCKVQARKEKYLLNKNKKMAEITPTFDKSLFTTEKPPMLEVCERYFGANWETGTIFAYKDKIHAKYPYTVSGDVIAHEKVHFAQQREFGDADKWWHEYLQNAEFRCSQEVQAYKAQIAYAVEHYNRNHRRALKQHIYESFAKLSAGTITETKAKELLG